MGSFDLAKHLNTAPELVDRVYNRPTMETLETKTIQGAVRPATQKVRVLGLVQLQNTSSLMKSKISCGIVVTLRLLQINPLMVYISSFLL